MEDVSPAPDARRRLWVALAATLVAVPLLVLDNLSAEGDGPGASTPSTARASVALAVPRDRPETGPAKGVSVVTTSTTSSTVPITVATTTGRS